MAYSLAVTPLTGTFPNGLRLVPFQRSDGHVVSPSWQSLQACATPEASDAAAASYRFQASASPACYPLGEPLFVSVRRSPCNATQAAPGVGTPLAECLRSISLA